MGTSRQGRHATLTDRAYDWPPLAGEYTFERLSIEPSVPRRPSASRTSDTLTLRIAHEEGGSDSFIILHADEIEWLASCLPDTARNMRLERLILQCQDMGYMPIRNEMLDIMTEGLHGPAEVFVTPREVEIAALLSKQAY